MIIDNEKDVEKFLEICEKSPPAQTNSDSKILSKDETNAFLHSEKFLEICEKSPSIQTNTDSKILSKDEANAFLNSEKFI